MTLGGKCAVSLGLGCALGLPSAHADCTDATNAYVRSIPAVITHERIHALNVVELMLLHAQANPEVYGEILQYVPVYGATHDFEKSTPEMAALICKYWNQNLDALQELPAEEKAKLMAARKHFVDRLNASEDKLKRKVLAAMELTWPDGTARSAKAKRAIQLLEDLEEIADRVERIGNPVSPEELGKLKMDAHYSITQFVGQRATTEARKASMQKEAWALLDRYRMMGEHFTYYADLLRTVDGQVVQNDLRLVAMEIQAESRVNTAVRTVLPSYSVSKTSMKVAEISAVGVSTNDPINRSPNASRQTAMQAEAVSDHHVVSSLVHAARCSDVYRATRKWVRRVIPRNQ